MMIKTSKNIINTHFSNIFFFLMAQNTSILPPLITLIRLILKKKQNHYELFRQFILENFGKYLKLKSNIANCREGYLFELYHAFSFNENYKNSGRKDLKILHQVRENFGPVDVLIQNANSHREIDYQLKFTKMEKKAKKAFRNKKYKNMQHISNNFIPENNIKNKIEYEDSKGKISSEPISYKRIEEMDKEFQSIILCKQINRKLRMLRLKKAIRFFLTAFTPFIDSMFLILGEKFWNYGKFQCFDEFLRSTMNDTLICSTMGSIIFWINLFVVKIAELLPKKLGTIFKISNFLFSIVFAGVVEDLKINLVRFIVLFIFLLSIPIPYINILIGSYFSAGLNSVIVKMLEKNKNFFRKYFF